MDIYRLAKSSLKGTGETVAPYDVYVARVVTVGLFSEDIMGF